jgi:hypothetical protein
MALFDDLKKKVTTSLTTVDQGKEKEEDIDTEVHIYMIRAAREIIKMSKRLSSNQPNAALNLLQWLTSTMSKNGKPSKWRVQYEYFEAIRNLIPVFGSLENQVHGGMVGQ